MKTIVDLKELQELIPETKALDGKNFKNMKHLMAGVIEFIEKSGKWEFVQYVSGNPSLFVIKESLAAKKVEANMMQEIDMHYNPQPAPTQPLFKKTAPQKKRVESSKEEKYESIEEPKIIKEINPEKLFNTSKMPWEK